MRQHLDEDLQLLVARVLIRARDVLGAEMIAALSRLATALRGARARSGRTCPAGRRTARPASRIPRISGDGAASRGCC